MRRPRTKPLARNEWLHRVRQMTATVKGPLEPGFGDGRVVEADEILYLRSFMKQWSGRRGEGSRVLVSRLGALTR